MTNEQKESFYLEVANFEGFRSCAYYCPAGCLSIGFGHRITDNERQRFSLCKLTFAEAYKLMKSDFETIFNELAKERFILEENELFAVADLCFNVGINTLRKRNIWHLLKTFSYCLDTNQHIRADKLRKEISERFLLYCHYKRNGKVYTSNGLLLRRRFDVKVFNNEFPLK